MNILMVGAGALGGYFGGRLLQAGKKVTFLLRANRIKQLQTTGGLVIKSPHGNFTIINPPYITSEQISQPYDLIIVSCKAYSLENCMESFAAAVGENTLILPMLNGITHLDKLCERFGKQKVLGGKVFISATLDNEGRIIHLNKLHTLGYGELDNSLSPRIQQLHQVLSNAGFDTKCSEQMLQEMWEKWIFIATAAGITCLMRAAICDIVKAGGNYLTQALLAECCAITQANGFTLKQSTIDSLRQSVTDPNSPLTSSMLRDLENGEMIEAQAIIGDFLNKAPANTQDNYPILKLIYTQLNSYLARRERNAL